MPLTLNVGLSRKVGLPDYSSVGADCHLAVELDAGLLADPAALALRIAQAQAIVAQAVETELARLHAPAVQATPLAVPGANGTSNGTGTNGTAKARHERQGRGPGSAGVETEARRAGPQFGSAAYATASQIALIRQLAAREGIELDRICEDYGVASLDRLDKKQASAIIDRFRSAD